VVSKKGYNSALKNYNQHAGFESTNIIIRLVDCLEDIKSDTESIKRNAIYMDDNNEGYIQF